MDTLGITTAGLYAPQWYVLATGSCLFGLFSDVSEDTAVNIENVTVHSV